MAKHHHVLEIQDTDIHGYCHRHSQRQNPADAQAFGNPNKYSQTVITPGDTASSPPSWHSIQQLLDRSSPYNHEDRMTSNWNYPNTESTCPHLGFRAATAFTLPAWWLKSVVQSHELEIGHDERQMPITLNYKHTLLALSSMFECSIDKADIEILLGDRIEGGRINNERSKEHQPLACGGWPQLWP